MRIAHLDVETTGLCVQKERIVEIAVVVTDEHMKVIGKYHKYIQPHVLISPVVTKIHGIGDKDVAKCNDFRAIKEDLSKVLHSADYVCAYNGLSYDRPLLIEEMSRWGYDPIPAVLDVWLDPFLMVGKPRFAPLFPDGRKRLVDLAKALGVPLVKAHNAMEDTMMQVACMRRMINEKMIEPNADEWFALQFGVKQ